MAKKPGKSQGIPRKSGGAGAFSASSGRGAAGARAGPKNVPVKTDSAALEEHTVARVERTIKTLDDFLGRWNASETKPDSMFPEVVKIQKFRDLLAGWRKDAINARAKNDEKSREKRLRDFVVLCKMYS